MPCTSWRNHSTNRAIGAYYPCKAEFRCHAPQPETGQPKDPIHPGGGAPNRSARRSAPTRCRGRWFSYYDAVLDGRGINSPHDRHASAYRFHETTHMHRRAGHNVLHRYARTSVDQNEVATTDEHGYKQSRTGHQEHVEPLEGVSYFTIRSKHPCASVVPILSSRRGMTSKGRAAMQFGSWKRCIRSPHRRPRSCSPPMRNDPPR